MSKRSLMSSVGKFEISSPHTEIVVPGKDQVKRFAIRAHPFGGKAGGVAGTDVP